MSAYAAGAIVIAGLGSAAMSANAAQNASDAQVGAARDANNTQLGMYNQQRADQAPYRQAGYDALNQMQQGMGDFNRSFNSGDFRADPGYQFRLQQGQQAIENSAASRGLLNSGATMKALSDYTQGSASQEYGSAYDRFNNDRSSRFNRLASMANLGQTGVGQTQAAGTNAANQMGANQLGMGNAQAAGQIGQANAINNGIGQGMNSWMNYSMMNRMYPSTGGGQGAGGGYGAAGGGYGGYGNVA